MTDQVFALHVATRNNLLTYLENLTPEQLAQIPNGFHNNIWWNIAHCVAQQQILCYKLSGLNFVVSETFVDTYKKGTYPDGHIPTAHEIQESVPKNNCKPTTSAEYSLTLPLILPAMAMRSLV